jgi:hypothetical protein
LTISRKPSSTAYVGRSTGPPDRRRRPVPERLAPRFAGSAAISVQHVRRASDMPTRAGVPAEPSGRTRTRTDPAVPAPVPAGISHVPDVRHPCRTPNGHPTHRGHDRHGSRSPHTWPLPDTHGTRPARRRGRRCQEKKYGGVHPGTRGERVERRESVGFVQSEHAATLSPARIARRKGGGRGSASSATTPRPALGS